MLKHKQAHDDKEEHCFLIRCSTSPFSTNNDVCETFAGTFEELDVHLDKICYDEYPAHSVEYDYNRHYRVAHAAA